MPSLEDFLAGKPLTPQLAKIMRGEEDEAPEQERIPQRNYADGTPITNTDREHLRRLLTSAGWEVLLKLLDTSLAHQEDAAREMSKAVGTSGDQISSAWKELAAAARSRVNMVALVEAEVERLKQSKKCTTGQTKTATVTN